MIKIGFLAAFIVTFIQSIEFEYKIPINKPKICFSEQLGKHINVKADIYQNNLEAINDSELIVNVINPINQIIEAFNSTKKITVAFTTEQQGTFQFCVKRLEKKETNFMFILLTGVEANDYSQLAQKEDLQPLEVLITRFEDQLEMVRNEMRMILGASQRRLANMDDISFKMIGFSVITIAMLILLALFQMQYMKDFFKQKKLI